MSSRRRRIVRARDRQDDDDQHERWFGAHRPSDRLVAVDGTHGGDGRIARLPTADEQGGDR